MKALLVYRDIFTTLLACFLPPARWPSGKASVSRVAGSMLTFAVDLFPGRVIPVT